MKFSLLMALLVATTTPAHAYLGPGLGSGVIGAIIGIIVAIFVGVLAFLYYPAKRMIQRMIKLCTSKNR